MTDCIINSLSLIITLYWTTALFAFVTFSNHTETKKERLISLGIAVLWPITTAVLGVVVLSSEFRYSVLRIRQDLEAKHLFDEFMQWKEAQEKENVDGF